MLSSEFEKGISELKKNLPLRVDAFVASIIYCVYNFPIAGLASLILEGPSKMEWWLFFALIFSDPILKNSGKFFRMLFLSSP